MLNRNLDILPFFQFLEIVVYAVGHVQFTCYVADVFKAYFKEYIPYISDLNFSKNSRQCGIISPSMDPRIREDDTKTNVFEHN